MTKAGSAFLGRKTIDLCGLSPSRKRKPLENDSFGLPWDPLSHRYSFLFEMHDRSLWESRGEEYVQSLRDADVPIYMQKREPDIPTSVPFPLQRAIDLGGDYFNSSIAYMFAIVALMDSNPDVNVYGVDNHTDEEWAFERPCNEYWIGLLRGMGRKVWIHPDSSLCKFQPDIRFNEAVVHYHRRYGWLEGTP